MKKWTIDTRRSFDAEKEITPGERTLYDLIEKAYEVEVAKRHCACSVDTPMRERLMFVAKWLRCGRRQGLYLNGGFGNGKSTTIAALKRVVPYISKGENYVTAYSTRDFSKFIRLNSEDMFDRILQSDILAIDDVGDEQKQTACYGNVIEIVPEIIFYRYAQDLMTIIATNKTEDEFKSRYGNAVADRFNEMFSMLAYTNPSYRK